MVESTVTKDTPCREIAVLRMGIVVIHFKPMINKTFHCGADFEVKGFISDQC